MKTNKATFQKILQESIEEALREEYETPRPNSIRSNKHDVLEAIKSAVGEAFNFMNKDGSIGAPLKAEAAWNKELHAFTVDGKRVDLDTIDIEPQYSTASEVSIDFRDVYFKEEDGGGKLRIYQVEALEGLHEFQEYLKAEWADKYMGQERP